MINRWGLAGLALALWATPGVAQEPSLATSDSPIEMSAEPPESPQQSEEPGELEPAGELEPGELEPTDEPGPDEPGPDEPGPDEPEPDEFAIEPTVDVTELKASLADLLPQTAPPPPIITNILPADTPAAIIVNTRADTWGALKQYALFAQLGEAFGVAPSPQVLPLLPLGMDYSEDVQPWVGDDVAIALLPVPSIRTISPVQRLVTILPINETAPFIDFIPTLAEALGTLPEQHSYRTFPIWHWPSEFVPYEEFSWEEEPADAELEEFPEPDPVELSPGAATAAPRAYRQPEPPYIYIPDPNDPHSADGYTLPGYAVAHLGNYIVAAENMESLRHWIEYQTQGGPTLTSNPNFQKTQGHPQAQTSLATVYGNVGQLLNFEFSNPFQGFGLPPIPQPSLSNRAAMSTLFSQVTFDALIYPAAEGMHLEAHLYTEGVLPDLPPSPNADHSILGLIPAATYMMGSGYDISGFWDDVSSAFSLNDVTGGLIETARSIVNLATGLDLDTDILGWMDGEYSLFLFPSRSGLLNSFFPGVGLEVGVLLETSNRSAAEVALTALDAVAGEDVALTAAIADHSVINWQYDINADGQLNSVLAHTWVTDDTLAFTTGSGAMERLVVPAGFNPLSGHSTFRNATESFPLPNNGYMYVNASSTLSFFYNLFGFNQSSDPWAADIRSYFGTVRSLSFSSSSRAQQFQIDALLGLAASEPVEAADDETDGTATAEPSDPEALGEEPSDPETLEEAPLDLEPLDPGATGEEAPAEATP